MINEDEIHVDCFDGLAAYYNGQEVEGQICIFTPPRDQVFKEIIFSLDGKKYKFHVEEVFEE